MPRPNGRYSTLVGYLFKINVKSLLSICYYVGSQKNICTFVIVYAFTRLYNQRKPKKFSAIP